MSRALEALAARTVGRRVRLTGGYVGTVTRVTGKGVTVTITGIRTAELGWPGIEEFLDD